MSNKATELATLAIAKPTPQRLGISRIWNWFALPFLLAGLIAIDRLTLVTPIHLEPISPWNPLLGVSIAIAMHHLPSGTLLAFVAATASALMVPNGPSPTLLSVLEGAMAAAQTIGVVLLSTRFTRIFSRHLVKIPTVGVVIAAPVVSAGATVVFIPALLGLDVIALSDVGVQAMRYWVGNVIAVVIIAPLFSFHFLASQKTKFTIPLALEAVGLGGIVVATVWVAFGEYPQTASRFLFIAFLPMIWIGLRFGAVGAVAMNALLQVSSIVSLMLAAHAGVNVTLFQALLLVLAFSGIIFGLAVDQSKAATSQLRAREEELSASLRMAATGELAGTLAHELGHPLGAISNYASALNHVLRKIAPHNAEATAIGVKLTQEVVRATDTLHRLRDFFRTGSLAVEETDICVIVKDAVALLRDRLSHNAISPQMVVEGGPNIVIGDRVQLGAVIYNLVVNAIDALKAVPEGRRHLLLRVRRSPDSVLLEVEDSGPGVANDVRSDIFEPLVTTKKDGLGLGLSMCRSVILAHGGTIALEDSNLGGAKFIITVPAH